MPFLVVPIQMFSEQSLVELFEYMGFLALWSLRPVLIELMQLDLRSLIHLQRASV